MLAGGAALQKGLLQQPRQARRSTSSRGAPRAILLECKRVVYERNLVKLNMFQAGDEMLVLIAREPVHGIGLKRCDMLKNGRHPEELLFILAHACWCWERAGCRHKLPCVSKFSLHTKTCWC